MGYTTDFVGQFNVNPRMTKAHAEYLQAFADTRRMVRNPEIAATMPDPKREAVGLPIGEQAGYFVGGPGFAGQDHDASIVDYNREPKAQPGLWCKWVPSKDLRGIKWSGMEKFYDYTEWLNYMIEYFLSPWGYEVSGEVRYRGASRDDRGVVRIVNGRAVKIAR